MTQDTDNIGEFITFNSEVDWLTVPSLVMSAAKSRFKRWILARLGIVWKMP